MNLKFICNKRPRFFFRSVLNIERTSEWLSLGALQREMGDFGFLSNALLSGDVKADRSIQHIKRLYLKHETHLYFCSLFALFF